MTMATGAILAVLVGFNMVILQAEMHITNDPNDNAFQYALVADAREIVHDVFAGRASVFDLIDSFNVRWNEGFPLSAYYAHLPQIALSLLSLALQVDAYMLFNYVKFALLVLLPIPFFVGGRILGLRRASALSAAVISQLVITDGLYGIDVTSFLWRGWGLSSQLAAIFFMPLAFATVYRYLKNGTHLVQAVLWNVVVASAHSGVFLMLGISHVVCVILIALDTLFFAPLGSSPDMPSGASQVTKKRVSVRNSSSWLVRRFVIVFGLIGLCISYFFVPFLLYGEYRNFSYWDPLWKFNSFGLPQVVTWFFNGDLFDFGRLPVVTLLVLFGFFYGLVHKRLVFRIMSMLFAVYLVLFMGRHSPFGFVFSVLPGFAEFHLHRFIVLVQFVGVYLAAELASVIVTGLLNILGSRISRVLSFVTVGIIVIITICILEKPIVNYAQHNANLIIQSNAQYEKEAPDFGELVKYLKSRASGRVYAGRPGNWGREFKIADMPLYMALAREGFETVGYAPQSWSPNAEYDQFFDDRQLSFYTLYNVHYVVLPKDISAPDFAKPIKIIGPYHVYEIASGGYFSGATSSTVVYGKKTHFVNFGHWWLASKAIVHNEYPIIDYGKKRHIVGKNILSLQGLTSYQDMNGKHYSLWERGPIYTGDVKAIKPKKISEKISRRTYSAVFTAPEKCFNCVIVLKNTYHPNWNVKVNGKKVKTYPVFPFYIGITVDSAGEYNVTAEYMPGKIKIILFIIPILIIGGYLFFVIRKIKVGR